MIDPNRGASEEALAQQKEMSYERLRLQLFEAVEGKLKEFGMTWNDLASKLLWWGPKPFNVDGREVKQIIGAQTLTLSEINQIAHCFSAEVYIIFRPRFPITQT